MSARFGSVSPEEVFPVPLMPVLSTLPFLLASSSPSFRPSPSVSSLVGSVTVEGSASPTNGVVVPVKGVPLFERPPGNGAVTPASTPSLIPSPSLSALNGLVAPVKGASGPVLFTSSPSLIPSLSVSESSGLVSIPAVNRPSGPTSWKSVRPSLSVSGSVGSVPRMASCAFVRPSLSASAAASSLPLPAVGSVPSRTSWPSLVPPPSVSALVGSVL